jgi:CheY-like chemotaxis protein
MPTSPVSRLKTLWLGPTDRAEFAAPSDVIVRETDCTLLSVAAAEEMPAGSLAGKVSPPGPFDLIVAAESFPDEVPPDVYMALRRRYPSARWIRLVGPWSDGELRSAAPPPATLRIPWHRAAAWLARQIELFTAGDRPEFDNPPTFDEADRVLTKHPRPPYKGRQATFAVWALEPAAREWLLATCDRLPPIRPISVEESRAGGPEVVLCDLPTADRAVEQLAQIRTTYPGASLVVLVGFARPREVQSLYEAGAAMVLAKPVTVTDLETAVHAVTNRLH